MGQQFGLPFDEMRRSQRRNTEVRLTRCWRKLDSKPRSFTRIAAFLRLSEPRLQPICTPILHPLAPLRQSNPTTLTRFRGRYSRIRQSVVPRGNRKLSRGIISISPNRLGNLPGDLHLCVHYPALREVSEKFPVAGYIEGVAAPGTGWSMSDSSVSKADRQRVTS
jgi:hypothetical protein